MTIHFNRLWQVLRSNDAQLLQSLGSVFEGPLKFLDVTSEESVESVGQSVIYNSYPRMGQSFLRTYLQKITGIATGSEMSLSKTIDQQLNGFIAEEIVDASVWIKKSHWPIAFNGFQIQFGNKILVCVRNPFDTIVSFMNFVTTCFNHSGQINEALDSEAEEWQQMVEDQIHNIREYHRYLLDQVVPKAPCYFIRYEDLRLSPQQTL